MTWRGFILQSTVRLREGQPVVMLFGTREDGCPFIIEDDRFRPYFFIRPEDRNRMEKEDVIEVTTTELRALNGRPVLKVVAPNPRAVVSLREKVPVAFEADVRVAYRYLIDRGIRAAIEVDAEPTRSDSKLAWYRNPELKPAEFRPLLRLLSLDIETSGNAREIYSISLVSDDVDEVHIVSSAEVPGAVAHADEKTLLRSFFERLREIDPDVLLGWNVVDFDLRVIDQRAKALRVPTQFGRVPGDIYIQRDPGYTRNVRCDIPGRQVLDGIPLVRDAFIPVQDYRLETVAQTLLGRGKQIDTNVDPVAEITRLYREDPAALAAYNREDSRLVLDILKQEGLIELTIERSLLSGMPLDRVGSSIASFDRLYLPELRKRGYVAPSVGSNSIGRGVSGGAVLDSAPGFYKNVVVFDFKSLYPSLIRTFNLDPLAHALAAEDVIEAPNNARFDREPAILAGILDRFFERRASAKARGDRHGDLAIKIMMNALFGVLGASSCRFFDPSIANAITRFGQQMLQWTQERFEAAGYRVLYGDTDSLFVSVEPERSANEARETALVLREHVQHELDVRIQQQYGVESRLQLELERIYERFFQPSVRGGTQGSKKRYAGWVEGELRIVGLEAVRRDWPRITGELQRGMLTRVFQDQPLAPFVRELVKSMQAGERDHDLVIHKNLRKGSLDNYTAKASPHIVAARKAGPGVRRDIRYLMTHSGPEPLIAGRGHPEKIDYTYYLDKMLKPVAESILEPLGEDFDEIIDAVRQLSLL